MKILIASTPKTGNTWLKHLLSEIYDLPIVDLPADYREGFQGERWVGHQHYLPESGLIERGREAGIVFLTTVRHPGDALVSLRHHVAHENVAGDGANDPAAMRRDGDGIFGEHTRRYVRRGYFMMLHVSVCWSQGGWARVVRYEELWRDPVGTLKRLTDRIVPVPEERIRAAVRTCELEQLRRRFPTEKRFYRQGGSGGWEQTLPLAIRWVFRRAPYRAQFAALGYAPLRGEGDAEARPFAKLRRRWRALRNLPLVLKIWWKLPEARQVRWLDAARGSETSLGWLNRPAAEDERVPTRFPIITKFALGLHLTEPSLPRNYPDPLGRNRAEFANWFLYFSPRIFGLDRSFILPMLHAWTRPGPRRCQQEI
ncbi:MAG TPA: hypothetical protein VG710_07655 [Opitutus sp.]|nr:hypothetical protein [Opitutus sp.]